PAREEPEHAGAVVLVEDAREDLGPERPADLLIHLGLAQVLRRRLVGPGDRLCATLPAVVLEGPLEALDADGRHRAAPALVGGRREPGLDAAHREADHAEA